MMLFHHVVCCLLLIVVTQCEEHLNPNGPFGKTHLSAKMLSPFNCNRSIGISPRSIRSTSVSISNLEVSSTHYSNSEEIYVSWTPSSSPCKDDFIGVYFVEIPVERGKEYN
jgi:hypothetical protein